MSDSERFQEAQQSRLAELRTLVKSKPAHAGFLADLERCVPGEILEDLPLEGVARRVADALIEDYEWTQQPVPEQGMRAAQFPNAYKNLRLKQARATAQGKRTRADNVTWSGFTFGGK